MHTHTGFKISFRHDDRPIDPSCGCEACRNYSRSYIHHLLKAGELLGGSLVSLHNVYFMNRLMTAIREVGFLCMWNSIHHTCRRILTTSPSFVHTHGRRQFPRARWTKRRRNGSCSHDFC